MPFGDATLDSKNPPADLHSPAPSEAPAGPGLSAAEVADRVRRGLVNRAARSPWPEYRDIFARNLFTLFNALVVPAGIALFFFAQYGDAWAVSAMVVINTVLALVQELRAKWHLDRLALLGEVRARVVREGTVQVIAAGDVVQDDHVLLTAGDTVVGDGPLLAARFLEVDEALLTGESDPVQRRVGERLLSGSVCVAGEGVYRAEGIGAAAFAHRTTMEARRYQYSASPMQRDINLLIRLLTATAVGLCLLYVGLWLLRGFATTDLVQMIAATATSMVPQGLVLMTTLAFTLGAISMSLGGAVVQRLNAVESMAAVDVLCMDKTGTLTSNQLRLAQLRVLGGADEDKVREALRAFAGTSLDQGSKTIMALRDALGAPSAAVPLLDFLPFKAQNRYSAARIRTPQGERVLVLGACEALRAYLAEGDGEWEAAWRELLPTGLRLLLFAEAEVGGTMPPFEGALRGRILRPLALVALSDALRPEAGGVLEALAAQGIAFKILSGDNPETVRATVANLALPLAHEPVASGDELASAADPAAFLRAHSVFGRVAPQQKLDIIRALQAEGHHVAMIGDGVNDVLSIKRADLGIAMGEGSAAARTVAGMVLENNNFELLPATLDEGRTILRNLRRSGKLFLLKNVYTLFLIVIAFGLFNLPFPYLPRQVTLLNALTIGVPAFFITLGRGRVRVPSREPYLREVGVFALSTGFVLGVAGLVVLLLSAWWRWDGEMTQRTLLLSTLVVMGLGTVWRVLTHGEREAPTGDWLLRGWVVLALPLYLLAMYWPLPADFFQLTPLGLAEWGLVLAVALPALLLCWLLDRLFLRRQS
jgi:cation-transporting P-type ATPase E